jgi:hypothetical protein
MRTLSGTPSTRFLCWLHQKHSSWYPAIETNIFSGSHLQMIKTTKITSCQHIVGGFSSRVASQTCTVPQSIFPGEKAWLQTSEPEAEKCIRCLPVSPKCGESEALTALQGTKAQLNTAHRHHKDAEISTYMSLVQMVSAKTLASERFLITLHLRTGSTQRI